MALVLESHCINSFPSQGKLYSCCLFLALLLRSISYLSVHLFVSTLFVKKTLVFIHKYPIKDGIGRKQMLYCYSIYGGKCMKF